MARRTTNRRAINEATAYAGSYADSSPFRIPIVPTNPPPGETEIFCANNHINPGDAGNANRQELVGGALQDVSPTDTQSIRNLTSSPIWNGCCFSVVSINNTRVVTEHNCAIAWQGNAAENWRCNDLVNGVRDTQIQVTGLVPLGGDGGPTSVDAEIPPTYFDDINIDDRVTVFYSGGVYRFSPYSHEELKLFRLRGPLELAQTQASADEINMAGQPITADRPLDVYDPLKVFTGRTGSYGVGALFSRRDCGLTIVWLQSPSRYLVGTLVAPMTINAQNEWEGMISANTAADIPFGLPFSSPDILHPNEKVFDPFGAFSLVAPGDRIVAIYNEDEDRYYAIYGQPGGGRIAGTITTGSASSFNMGSIEVIVPPGPDATVVTVFNRFQWPVEPGLRALAEYNHTTKQWEAYQLQCAGSGA